MDLFGFDPPALDTVTAAAIVARHWRIGGAPERIRGERSANTVLTTSDGMRYVLQVFGGGERPDVIDLQIAALEHLAARDPSLPVPRVVPTPDGVARVTVDVRGEPHDARLLTYLAGETFDDEAPLSRNAYRAIGALLGRICAGLADFDHPAADHFMPWDIGNGLIVDPSLREHIDADAAAALAACDERLEAVASLVPTLPHQTVHNDGHAGNLLRSGPSSEIVTGLIDFGDLVRTAVAADVAVIGESFAPSADRPDEVLAAIASGYHGQRPLDPVEIGALPELVLARAALNVLLVEHQLRSVPHVFIDGGGARRWAIDRLHRWQALDPAMLSDRIHDALEHP